MCVCDPSGMRNRDRAITGACWLARQPSQKAYKLCDLREIPSQENKGVTELDGQTTNTHACTTCGDTYLRWRNDWMVENAQDYWPLASTSTLMCAHSLSLSLFFLSCLCFFVKFLALSWYWLEYLIYSLDNYHGCFWGSAQIPLSSHTKAFSVASYSGNYGIVTRMSLDSWDDLGSSTFLHLPIWTSQAAAFL